MKPQVKAKVKAPKAQTYFSRQNLQWLGIFLAFLAFLSLLFMVMSNRKTSRIISKSKPLVVNEIDVDENNNSDNLFEELEFQKIHTEFQASYLELIQKITTKSSGDSKGGTISFDIKKDALLFQTYKTAQSNYEKVLKRVEDHEKEFKLKCFARMRKLILAVLFYDKKFGKRMTKFDTDKLLEIGALDEIPVCPQNGEYSIIYKNGRRLFNCSIHGVLKN